MLRFILLLLIPVALFSQVTFSGKIIDAKTKEALPGASIYIPGSSIGTTSNLLGDFSLKLPLNTKEIVISFLGYNTINATIDVSDGKDFSNVIGLRENSTQLNEVVLVKPKIDAKWKRQYALFKKHFLGESSIATKAKILNPENLYFEETYNSGGYQLVAKSNIPLLVKNKNTGYLINCELLSFSFTRLKDFTTYTQYEGYLFFEDLNKEKVKKSILKNRLKAYKGSIQHFITSVYNNTFLEEGFLVNEYIIKDNPDYPSEDELKEIRQEAQKTGDYTVVNNLPSKRISILGRSYKKEDFVYQMENQHFLDYANFIYIRFEEKTDVNFHPSSAIQTSYLELLKKVEFFQNGYYYLPTDLILHDYMGRKKIGDALPLNYKP